MKLKKYQKIGLLSGLVVVLIGSVLLLPVFSDSATHEAKRNAAECCDGWITEGGTVQSGKKFNLNFRIEGTGKPAIVIGLPNFYARTFSKELRSHLRLVFVDHRGSAPTTEEDDVNITEDYAIEKVVDDVELMRTTLGLGEVAVIGHGGQANLAIEYVVKYPDHVSHLVMIGMPYLEVPFEIRHQTFPNLASPERQAIQAKNEERITDEFLASLSPSESSVKRFIRDSPTMFYNPYLETSKFWKWVDMDDRFFAYLWDIKTLGNISISERLQTVKIPVAVIVGPYDFHAPPLDYWNPLVKRLDHVKLMVFKKSGHLPQYEQPKAFDERLLGWMGILSK